MKEEWANKFGLDSFTIKKITPKDDKKYFISHDIIDFTSGILIEYGRLVPPNEGFVYWAGKIKNGKIIVFSAFAPATISTKGSVEIISRSNIEFVLFLSRNRLIHIANIHTHSGSWVGHSAGDDIMVPFKKPGLLSIVVPHYGKGKFDMLKCGINRFDNGCFSQLSKTYTRDHIKLVPLESVLFDDRG
jgi:hypothetical protein